MEKAYGYLSYDGAHVCIAKSTESVIGILAELLILLWRNNGKKALIIQVDRFSLNQIQIIQLIRCQLFLRVYRSKILVPSFFSKDG